MIYGFMPLGFNGLLVRVEVNIRRGIPAIEVVGLPDGAVREARDRIRIAIQQSDFQFPQDRILINLTPAGVKKEGAGYDLSMAVGILEATGQLSLPKEERILFLGELTLSGEIIATKGVLSGIITGWEQGITTFIVPEANRKEAELLGKGVILSIQELKEIIPLMESRSPIKREKSFQEYNYSSKELYFNSEEDFIDMSDIKGQPVLRRALEIAATGRHHTLLFGPPGCGKTMGAKRLSTILPPLNPKEALEVTRIYSETDNLFCSELISKAPFRSPHHSASLEGVVGGGKLLLPGEVSLAHKGVLFLDETGEFSPRLLQGLREPLEDKVISLTRAEQKAWYPSDFQLIMATNLCPCGRMGKKNERCVCSKNEVVNYWKKLGGALLDRVEIRVPLSPIDAEDILSPPEESSESIYKRIQKAVAIQEKRYSRNRYNRNSNIPPNHLSTYCQITDEAKKIFTQGVNQLELSTRAGHAVLRVARTIADLEGEELLANSHILEALQHRRYGGKDLYFFSL